MSLDQSNWDKIVLDKEQSKIWDYLQDISQQIDKKSKSYFNFLKPKVKGAYIWGPVGRGKTMLVNKFYASLTTDRKLRVHFQHFMKLVHKKLFNLTGADNAIEALAIDFNRSYDVICLDELYIDDIADAFIIANILKEFYKKDIVFVFTTNIPPERLYHALYSDRFLDEVNLLKYNNYVFNLDNLQDYRLLYNKCTEVFFFNDYSKAKDEKLLAFYLSKSNNKALSPGVIEVNHRKIKFKAQTQDMIWFEFDELCEKPRSQLDYIDLASKFNTVIISNIPQLDDGSAKDDEFATFCKDRTRRFISLIDEFYDQAVLLVATFECSLNSLYLADDFKFQFKRVNSRLFEMQSFNYFNNQVIA